MMKFTLFYSLLASLCLCAQESAVPAAAITPATAVPTAVALADDGARVTVLGYHELAEKLPETAMRIRTSKFRQQMATIRQLGITVISLDDFIAWKTGTKTIPAKSLLLTFDDGWKSVYTDAFPILREFNYPFTLYLYKNYVDGGGKALTTAMIREMMAAGASLGSHSVSHPYPHTVKKFRTKGPADFAAFMRAEMAGSKQFLESAFSVSVTSYAYPGGYFTEDMPPIGNDVGYRYYFTVQPGKVQRATPNEKLPRYMIFGNHDSVFELSTNFREPLSKGGAHADATIGMPQTTPCPVAPEAGAIINSRLPVISADLSKMPDFDPKTIVMRVAGFGEVPATFAPDTKLLTWQVNRRLRQPTCQVAVHWKDAAGKVTETPLRWSFQIDRDAAYMAGDE